MRNLAFVLRRSCGCNFIHSPSASQWTLEPSAFRRWLLPGPGAVEIQLESAVRNQVEATTPYNGVLRIAAPGRSCQSPTLVPHPVCRLRHLSRFGYLPMAIGPPGTHGFRDRRIHEPDPGLGVLGVENRPGSSRLRSAKPAVTRVREGHLDAAPVIRHSDAGSISVGASGRDNAATRDGALNRHRRQCARQCPCGDHEPALPA